MAEKGKEEVVEGPIDPDWEDKGHCSRVRWEVGWWGQKRNNFYTICPDGNTIIKVKESLSYRAIFGGCWLFHVCGTKINQLSQSYEGPMSDSLSRRECVGLRSEKGGGGTILDMAFLSKCGQLSSMSIFIQTKRGNEKLLKI